MSDAETAADAFDLEKLEAQVREEEAGALSRLLVRVMTPSSVGALRYFNSCSRFAADVKTPCGPARADAGRRAG